MSQLFCAWGLSWLAHLGFANRGRLGPITFHVICRRPDQRSDPAEKSPPQEAIQQRDRRRVVVTTTGNNEQISKQPPMSRAPESVLGRELSPGEYGSKRVSEVSPALTAALSRGDNFPAPI